MAPKKASSKADPGRTPLPEELKRAFRQPWRKDCGIPLVPWLTRLVMAYDWTI